MVSWCALKFDLVLSPSESGRLEFSELGLMFFGRYYFDLFSLVNQSIWSGIWCLLHYNESKLYVLMFNFPELGLMFSWGLVVSCVFLLTVALICSTLEYYLDVVSLLRSCSFWILGKFIFWCVKIRPVLWSPLWIFLVLNLVCGVFWSLRWYLGWGKVHFLLRQNLTFSLLLLIEFTYDNFTSRLLLLVLFLWVCPLLSVWSSIKLPLKKLG